MRKILYCIFISGLILVSCDKDNDKSSISECNVENPIEELDWLKEVKNSLTNCTCQTSILQGLYDSKTVFYIMVTDPLCNSVFQIILWDCKGDIVKEYKPGDNDIFSSEVEFVKSIYTCTNK
jgi:hypothetical protein